MNSSDRRDEVEAKLERVRRWLRNGQHGALLVRQRTNFAWLTAGGRSHVNTARDAGAAALLVTPDRFVLVASNIEARRLAEEELSDVPVDVAEYPWERPGAENVVLASMAGPEVVIADTQPTVGTAMQRLRASLLEPERRRFEELGRLTSVLAEDVCWGLEPGCTEDGVAARLHAAAAAVGARLPVCLVAADERIALRRHPLPVGQPIRQRVMIALCVEVGGLVCSITRLVNFTPLSDDLRRRHQVVCEVEAAAFAGTRVGRPLSAVFADIVEGYAVGGFAEEWHFHHQGGSTGYQPRDVIASPASEAAVQENQAFAWNPSIAGTKGEDTMFTGADGPRWITTASERWPHTVVAVDGATILRPGILVR